MDKNTFSFSDGGATIGGFYPDIRNKKIFVDKLRMTLNKVALKD